MHMSNYQNGIKIYKIHCMIFIKSILIRAVYLEIATKHKEYFIIRFLNYERINMVYHLWVNQVILSTCVLLLLEDQ